MYRLFFCTFPWKVVPQYLGMNTPENIITGTVIAVHPESCSCDVVMTAGGVIYNVGVMNSMGGPFSTDVNPIPNLKGAAVALINLLNQWYILGTIPVHAAPPVQVSPSVSNTGTSTDNENTYGKSDVPERTSYANGRTTSVLPGDKLISADGGSELLLGAEGLAVLKASPLAQLILGGFKDFVKLVAREFTLNTDFGVMKFSGGGSGTTGLSIMGGANFCDESGTNNPVYTVKMFMGEVPGDPLARFALYVYNTDRSEYVYIVVDNIGNISIETSKDEEKLIGRDKITEIMENRRTTVHIDDTLTVDNNRSASIGNNDECTVGVDQTLTVHGKRTVSTTDTEQHNVGSTMELNVGMLVVNTGGLTFNSRGDSGSSGDCTITCPSLNFVKA